MLLGFHFKEDLTLTCCLILTADQAQLPLVKWVFFLVSVRRGRVSGVGVSCVDPHS